jgi:transcriptional regulator with XRE-family HTH domain
MTQPRADITAVAAARMRAIRNAQGMSAERLAAEMTLQGTGWTREIVTNLENGRRDTLGVSELLALALVLGVPPIMLLVDPMSDSTDVTPTASVPTAAALLWLLGEEPIGRASAAWTAESELIRLVHDWRHMLKRLHTVRAQLREASLELRVALKQFVADAEENLHEAELRLAEAGMPVPPPSVVAGVMTVSATATTSAEASLTAVVTGKGEQLPDDSAPPTPSSRSEPDRR